jgi:hypothetical protein
MSVADHFNCQGLKENLVMPLHEKKRIGGSFVLITLAILSSIVVHAASRSSKSEREVEYRRSLYTPQ